MNQFYPPNTQSPKGVDDFEVVCPNCGGIMDVKELEMLLVCLKCEHIIDLN